MSKKPAMSLTDQAHEFSQSMVEDGKFASLSAVMQPGSQLAEREKADHRALLEAIRADLDRRAETPSLSTKDMDRRLAAWRSGRDGAEPVELA